MAKSPFKRVGRFKEAGEFIEYLNELGVDLPCAESLASGEGSPMAAPVQAGGLTIGNRYAIHPMEGWDAERDGKPTEYTFRRWKRFGASGAKMIWGGEAFAVVPEGRANPNQSMILEENLSEIARLKQTLVDEHTATMGSDEGLVVGMQLTHSGRFCRPNKKDTLEPRVAYRHKILDQKFGIDDDSYIMSDDEVKALIEAFVAGAVRARKLGFDFVDVKHCHGYLGHEFLSAYDRPGPYGGSFENRTRFLREIVAGIRSEAPGLAIAVRLSAFDRPPYKPDPEQTQGVKLGPGIPEQWQDALPYNGFGCDRDNPLNMDLSETHQFLDLLEELDIKLVNISAGSPYYNPHIQRPALFPPSDGYQPPEDPLVGCARQIAVVRDLKAQHPGQVFLGSGYTYFQDYLPHVAQAVVEAGWVDIVGLGRMVLSYPEMPRDVIRGHELRTKQICRTFSDCTTAPRNGIISGCYPLDDFYKKSEQMVQLKLVKSGKA